jgi:2-polyprenyl-6-methoxyphenol hydroxylase-like FAD-dependent oxidoreductase
MHELGLLEELLKRPHQKVDQVRARIGGESILLGNMSYLRTRCRFFVMMPQWNFLDFLAEQGRRYPTFHLRMQSEVTGLIEDQDRIAGVRVNTPAGPTEVCADLVVGADGRNSVVRDCSGLAVQDLGAPTDALWMRLSKRTGDPDFSVLADRGKLFVIFDRGDYLQCAFAILKGSAEELQRGGIEGFRADIVEIAPFLHDRVAELRDWNDVKLLTVRVNRLRRWYRSGLVCIGDAAHAMSPVAGIGINLAIQDAVATANILTEPLRKGSVSVVDLAKIQRRRALPTRVTQRLQEVIRKQVGRDVGRSGTARPPWPIRLLERTTLPCRFRTRFVGVGIRPEHVKTPDVSK